MPRGLCGTSSGWAKAEKHTGEWGSMKMRRHRTAEYSQSLQTAQGPKLEGRGAVVGEWAGWGDMMQRGPRSSEGQVGTWTHSGK